MMWDQDFMAMPAYPTSMIHPEDGVAMIQDEFLRELINRIGSKSNDVVLRNLSSRLRTDNFVIELVVRGINRKLNNVATLVHCTGDNAKENANKYLHIIKDKIEEIKRGS